MIGSVITWITVPVSSFVCKNKGLGSEDTSSAEVRAPPENSRHQQVRGRPSSGHNSEESTRRDTQSIVSTHNCTGIDPTPLQSTMNKSRPSSRRQSNTGTGNGSSFQCDMGQLLICLCVGESKRISLDGIQEENSQRHVKFNIDFDEWRR
jgi:hypothetical protein